MVRQPGIKETYINGRYIILNKKLLIEIIKMYNNRLTTTDHCMLVGRKFFKMTTTLPEWLEIKLWIKSRFKSATQIYTSHFSDWASGRKLWHKIYKKHTCNRKICGALQKKWDTCVPSGYGQFTITFFEGQSGGGGRVFAPLWRDYVCGCSL